MPPLISVHTPCWNRGEYLERVWNGLCRQTFRDFEWIVADDGSTDNTREVLERIKRSSPFPVITVSASQRVGKATIDNSAVRVARGSFFLWNDSDDVLLPAALQTLLDAWESIPPSERDRFIGVTALCRTEEGMISSSLPFPGVFDTTWNDMRFLYRVQGDMTYFCRTDLLKVHPFPEVDFYVPESSVWVRIGAVFKARVVPEVVQVKEYRAPNAVSFSRKMEYCRGKVHEIAISREYAAKYGRGWSEELWQAITYLRYCRHGEMGIGKAVTLWRGKYKLILLAIAFPFALMLALKDTAQGRVRRSHREFLRARERATIEVDRGGAGC